MNRKTNIRILIVFVIAAFVIIVVTGFLYYRYAAGNYKEQFGRQLSAIADLKVHEIEQWRKERLADAEIFHDNRAFADLVNKYFKNAKDKGVEGKIENWLNNIFRSGAYNRVFLLDTQFTGRVSVSRNKESSTAYVSPEDVKKIKKGNIAFGDFFKDTTSGKIFLEIIIPVLAGKNYDKTAGYIALRINPDDYLYPLINTWPTPAKTAETLILRREGDEVVFLNSLKFKKDAALTLRAPVNGTIAIPAIKASQGYEGIVDDIDYRGVHVIAATRTIHGSPWFMVARIDAEEAYEPMKNRLWTLVLIISVFLACAALGFGFILKQRRLRFTREKEDALRILNENLEATNKIINDEIAEKTRVMHELEVREKKLQTQNELIRESEEKFRQLFDSIPDAVFIHDMDGRFLKVNTVACDRLGYSNDEFLKLSVVNISNAPAATITEGMKIISKKGKAVVDTEQVSRNGKIIPTELSCCVIEYAGKPAVMSVARDITERKKAEAELNKLAAALEQSPISIVITKPDSTIEYANRKFLSVTGYTLDEVKGAKPNVLKSGVHEPDFYSGMWKALLKGETWNGIICNKKKNGELYWERAVIFPVTGFGGKTEYYIGMKEDISVQLKAERALEREMLINKTLTELSAEIISPDLTIEKIAAVTFDISKKLTGSQHGYVAIIDDNTGDMISVTLSEMMKGQCNVKEKKIVFAKGKNSYPSLWGHSLNTKKGFYTNSPSAHTTSVGLPEGHIPLNSYLSVPAIIDDKIIGQISLANAPKGYSDSDLALIEKAAALYAIAVLRKKNETMLHEALKTAEDANRMKSEFLANMSHEIRTPLNAIVGFSSILKEKTAGQNVFTEYLNNITQSSSVLLNLINDILDLSKVEAGRMVTDYQPVNLSSIIDEINSVFRMKASEKGLLLDFTVSKEIPGSIITDEKYLRQILFNLVGNAVKFTHSGGVNIAVNIIPKETESSKTDLEFIIKDTGIGIAPDQLTGIFEPFVQARRKDKNLYGGTGLGLSITKRLVELLGGTITAKSEYGKGSVFTVFLYNIETASLHNNLYNEDKSRDLSGIKFHNPVILMAEDVQSNRQIVKHYLEPMNITIIETVNGEECLNAIRRQRPDLILMDMQMPVMDGYTAINIIKSDDALKDIPVIALTASAMKQQKDKYEKIANDFLIKPIYKNELLEILIKYLPYEELHATEKKPEEISDAQTPATGDTNCHSRESGNPCQKNKLPPGIKEEIAEKFVPALIKLQETLNMDELSGFVRMLEEYNEAKQNPEIAGYCKQLKEYIQTFNIAKIKNTLKELTEFINK